MFVYDFTSSRGVMDHKCLNETGSETKSNTDIDFDPSFGAKIILKSVPERLRKSFE